MSDDRLLFTEELESLRSQLLEMGSAVDEMIADATRALANRDVPLAELVIYADDRIDEMDLRIEATCMRLLALQHPVARDLRLVGSAMKVITDLERIADHCVDIAKVARKLAKDEISRPLADIPRMAQSVRQMLRDALESLLRHDLELVERVVHADDSVDEQFHKIRDDLHAAMILQPDIVVQASYLLFVAHYLERMADHAVNIAERVHFVETGKIAQLAKSHKTG